MTTLIASTLAVLCVIVLVRDRPPSSRLFDEGRGRVRHGTAISKGSLLGSLTLIAVWLGSPVVIVAAPLLAAFVRRELARRRHHKRVRLRADMVLGFVDVAGSGLRAGRSLTAAVLEVADGMFGPLPNEFQLRVRERVEAGRRFALAVDEVFDSDQPDEHLVATTVRALDATGASAGEALERVAEALRERQSSREDARTQAQHALSSAGVLAALPVVFGVAAALAEPEVAQLYLSTWVGAACVVLALLCVFGSWEWLQRLLVVNR